MIRQISNHCSRCALWIFPAFICLAAATILSAADVSLDAVLKTQILQQLNTGAPTVPTTNGFSFQAFVVAATNNVVTNAVVKLPNSTTRTQVFESELNLRFEEKFNSSGALDAAYPHSSLFGVTYQMQMKTVNDGPRSNNCAYAALLLAGGYPTTPQIAAANWTAAQSIDHTRSFVLQWNNLGGNANDIVQLLIYQNETNLVYVSDLPFTTNALTGMSNSVAIPGYKLPAGTNLTGHLLIIHVAGLPDTSYATGAALLGKETVFPMQTRPAPPPPVLTLLARTPTQTQLTLTGETNRTWQIQATDDWLAWQTLLTTNSASGKFFFADTSPTNTTRFYRGRAGD